MASSSSSLAEVRWRLRKKNISVDLRLSAAKWFFMIFRTPQFATGGERLPQMTSEEHGYKHAELTEQIIGVFYEVYNELGVGFLEKVYQEAMALVLRSRGFEVQCQVSVPVWFHGTKIGTYEADLVVAGSVLVELKACKALDRAHEAQLLNYLRSTVIEVGLLLNFGSRPQVRRFAFENERKGISVHLRSSAAKGPS